MDNKIVLRVPTGVDFSDLNLDISQISGQLIYDERPLQIICEASGVNFHSIVSNDQAVYDLISLWYQAHLENGGDIDLVQELINAENEAESTYGVERVQSGSKKWH
ncbi:hypothetical protein [Acidihalobacter prosperus]